VRPKRDPNAPKVKTIFWDTVKDVKDTVWAGRAARSQAAVMKELFPDLKDLFTEKARAPAGGAGSGGGGGDAAAATPAVAKVKAVEFMNELDSKRAYNMGISLSKFKRVEGGGAGARGIGGPRLPGGGAPGVCRGPGRGGVGGGGGGVRAAVVDMDLSALGGLEGVEVLLTWRPVKAEVDRGKEEEAKLVAARAAAGTGTQVPDLGFLERYVVELGKVAKLEDRLRCMKLRETFMEAVRVEERSVALLDAACREITDNGRLRSFLVDVVLPVGNELNKGTRSAGARGVTIGGLMKLAQTRTADNSMTVLFYIVSKLSAANPALLELVTEFRHVRDAQRLEFSNLDAAAADLRKNLKTLTDALDAATKAADAPFLDAMAAFVADAARSLEGHLARYAIAKEAFGRVLRYLAADAAATPNVLFKEWWAFIDVFTATINQFRAARERDAKRARAEADKAARSGGGPGPAGSPASSGRLTSSAAVAAVVGSPGGGGFSSSGGGSGAGGGGGAR